MGHRICLSVGVHFAGSSPTPLTGAYDALGRLGAVDLDETGTGSSLAHASWQYKPYSGLLDAARASLGLSPGTTDVYRVTGKTYRGLKLTGYRDEVGGTDYSYWYTDAGQLRGATATPFATSPLSQNSSMCSSYTLSKAFGAGASFGNLELVRETTSPAFSDTYAYGGQGVQTAVPPGPDAPTALTTNSSQNPFLYDHAGRVSSKGLGTESFEYDLFNRLVRVSRSGVQAEALAHDPFGLLLGRVSGDQVTYYLGGRATVTATALPNCGGPGCAVDDTTVKVDVHLGAVASVRLQGGSTGRVLYYHRDHLGSVVATSKGGGTAGASYRYGPWGDLRVAQGGTGDAASERGFAGSIRLSGTLLVMGVRVYDTQLRQFLQPDPIDPMTYTYVRGDPVNLVDRTGMTPGFPPIIVEDGMPGPISPPPPPPPSPCGADECITVTGHRDYRWNTEFWRDYQLGELKDRGQGGGNRGRAAERGSGEVDGRPEAANENGGGGGSGRETVAAGSVGKLGRLIVLLMKLFTGEEGPPPPPPPVPPVVDVPTGPPPPRPPGMGPPILIQIFLDPRLYPPELRGAPSVNGGT